MTKSNLSNVSAEYRKQAAKILKNSRVIELFSDYGTVKLVGSYALNVMLRPDLDIYVLTKKQDFEKLSKILNRLFSKNYFQQICFANWYDFSRESGIEGYYLEPKINIGKNRWKLDIWFMTEDQYKPHTEKFLGLLNNDFNPEIKRGIILELKNHFRDGEKYKGNINGKMIYKAVLEDGIKTPKEFEERYGLS